MISTPRLQDLGLTDALEVPTVVEDFCLSSNQMPNECLVVRMSNG